MASMRLSIGVVVVVIINLIMVVIKVEALIKDFLATWWPPWGFPLELLSPEVPQVFAHPPKMKSSSQDCVQNRSKIMGGLKVTNYHVDCGQMAYLVLASQRSQNKNYFLDFRDWIFQFSAELLLLYLFGLAHFSKRWFDGAQRIEI